MNEKKTLECLVENTTIVIKNPDKGGSVVVLDSQSYKDEALRKLSDVTTYCKLRGDPTESFKKELSELLGRAVSVGIFSPKEK